MPLSLSKRVTAISPSLTLAIDSKAKEMKQKGLDVVSFGAGEPDFDTPEYIRNAAKYALDQGMTRYTPAAGTLSLRQAICDKLERENGLHYAPAQIVVCNGAKHALSNVFHAIIDAASLDEVLIPTPCWVSYTELVKCAGGKPVFVPTREENRFIATAEDIRPYVTERTKALVLNSPNNPNGCVWPVEELKKIAQLAVEKGFYVVSDEIYEKLIYDGETHVSIATLGEEIFRQTIVINGMSKAFAMTGWRIGYTASSPEIAKAMASYQSHATSNPNAIAQYASEIALTDLQKGEATISAMVGEFDRRRQRIVSLINAIPGLSTALPKGAFYVMMNISRLIGKTYNGRVIAGSSDFADCLLEAELVAVVPGVAFQADGYCRLSYATSMENIERGILRIADFVQKLV
jgi:aspartate aminotransferase